MIPLFCPHRCWWQRLKKTKQKGLSPYEQDRFRDFWEIYGLMQWCSQVQPDPKGGLLDWDGGHLSTLSCSRNHFEATGALWHDMLSCWKRAIRRRFTVVIKGGMWSGTKLRWPGVFERRLLVTKKPKCSGKICPMLSDQQFYQPFLPKARQDGSVLSRSHPSSDSTLQMPQWRSSQISQHFLTTML